MTVFLAMLLAASLAADQSRTRPAGVGSIRGQIIEARTGTRLTAVLVQVQDTNQRALSDEDGRFELSGVPAGPQTLLVSVVGYGLVHREVVVAADAAVDLTIPVAEGASTYVEEVTVRGSAFREAETGLASQTVIGSRDLLVLRGLLADDPFRAVQTLPGVATGDDFRAEFAIRGLGPQHVGLSIDGVDSPLLFHTVRGVDDTGSLALVNSDVLDSASVVAGARPQRLNAHLGAAVDFATRDGATDRLHIRGMLSVTAATTTWEGPLGAGTRGSWLVAVRQSYLDWLLRKMDPRTTGTFGFTDLQAKLTWLMTPGQSVRLIFLGGRSMLRDREEFPGRNTLDRGANRTLIGNLQWQLVATPTVTIAQQLYLVDASYENRVPDGRVRQAGTDGDVTWRGRVEWTPASRHFIEFGGQAQVLRTARVDRTFRPTSVIVNVDTGGRTASAASWVHTRWTLSPRVIVSPGVRFDAWEITGTTAASPWLLAEWQMGRQTRLRGGVAVQRQAPFLEQDTRATLDAPLSVERARAFDLGVERRFGDLWRANIGVYQRKENDRLRLVAAEPSVRQGIFVPARDPHWQNTMTGVARGLGFSLERRSVNGVSGWIGYSYEHADLSDEVTGETFPSDYDQRHTLNGYAIYRHSSRTSLSGRLRLGSNFPLPGYYERIFGDWYLSDERNLLRLRAYGRLDVRADRSFTYRRRRLTLFAEALNVFGRTNVRASTDPLVNSSTGQVRNATQALFPLLPSLGVLLEF
jgi:hypothetical protein